MLEKAEIQVLQAVLEALALKVHLDYKDVLELLVPQALMVTRDQ